MTIDSIDSLFVHELKDTFDAEKRLVRALPKMAKSASSEELRSLFLEHAEQTKGQVSRIEQIFQLLEAKAQGKTCLGMKGLIEEGEEAMSQEAEEEYLSDVALIGAARRVEHYEMASYRSLQALADIIGNPKISDLLQQTLDEEEQADQKLSDLCETIIEDAQSSAEDEDEVDEDEEEAEPAPARKR